MIVTLPQRRNIELSVTAPPSKSYTHRALVAAALAEGESTIINPLIADDTKLTAAALTKLGVTISGDAKSVTVAGCNGKLSCPPGTVLDLDNSGTSLRLLAGTALLSDNPVTLTGSARMQERPFGPLADTLHGLGGMIVFAKNEGYPPVTIGGRLLGGYATIDGSVSSQYASSVLMVAPYAKGPVDVTITGTPASQSYLDITAGVMTDFGAKIRREGYRHFVVSPKDRYSGRTYVIEGDYSSASYFFALAAICEGKVSVSGLQPLSVQGDRRFLDALEMMGCQVTYAGDRVTVSHEGPLSGITIDMSSAPDTVQTLCMVAAVARSRTVITGISHLKYKESDRVAITADRLRHLGGNVTTDNDRIIIDPAPLHGGVIDPANDHRTAMSFAILGLGIGDVSITGADCTTKSFPEFWNILSPVMA
ncbi:3-phosphoshikimate 1-carboxyvinyltransferase [Methanoregula sp. UBA64]|jgi:3-phosphoshikimate 1-carboxyvinyltransferase|uniref:3-phosphoshikimate 1-carboxyvinyltransferase n=1 Tax=Methanoregula sp. UBA64 TaxID=1915554 RepID=UPI0025F52701|nr:3-phosphoshikimate 1-carboxyvinyltransferase [Methanoregula sp. UBA64]